MNTAVFLIVGPNYSGSLSELLREGSIWIVRSPSNDDSIRRFREACTPSGDTFTDFEGSDTPLDSFVEILSTVDEHLGGHPVLGNWELLHVIGLSIVEADDVWISSELSVPVSLHARKDGFTIRRDIASI